MVFHVPQPNERATILVRLHRESQLVHAGDEIGIDDTPLADVVDITMIQSSATNPSILIVLLFKSRVKRRKENIAQAKRRTANKNILY